MPMIGNSGYGWSGFIGMAIWMLIWSAALTLLIWWMVRLLNRRSEMPGQRSAPGVPNRPSALEIIQRRLCTRRIGCGGIWGDAGTP